MRNLGLWIRLEFAHWQADRVARRLRGGDWHWLLTVLFFAFLLLACASPSQESQMHVRTWYSTEQLYLATSHTLSRMHIKKVECSDLWEICEAVSQESLRLPIQEPEARCLSVIFGESGFRPEASHKNKRTWDYGLMQTNEIHYLKRKHYKTSEYQKFCRQRGWNDDTSLKTDIGRNVAFGCHLWRMELKQGKRSYQWAKRARPDQQRFYTLLRDRLRE